MSKTKTIFYSLIFGGLAFELIRNPAMLANRETFTLFKVVFLSIMAALFLVRATKTVISPFPPANRVLAGLLVLGTATFLVTIALRFV